MDDIRTAESVLIDVLGPLRVRVAERELALPSHRERALLVLLASRANQVVSADRLVEELWDGAPPAGAKITLRSYISHLRRLLDVDGPGTGPIATVARGYRLVMSPDDLDVSRFREHVAAGHRHLREEKPRVALDDFDQALALWRGDPLHELAHHSAVLALTAELDALRGGAREGRLRALVDLGRHAEALPVLESLATREPHRESLHELLMLALHRSGRTADALDAHRRLRDSLREQLGIDPGQQIGQLLESILNRDPRLELSGSVSHDLVAARTDAGQSTKDLIIELTRAVESMSVQLARVLSTVGSPDVGWQGGEREPWTRRSSAHGAPTAMAS